MIFPHTYVGKARTIHVPWDNGRAKHQGEHTKGMGLKVEGHPRHAHKPRGQYSYIYHGFDDRGKGVCGHLVGRLGESMLGHVCM